MDPTQLLTVAALFTVPGALAAAAIIRQLIEIIKTAAPAIDARFSGALQAFVLSFVLYLFAAIAYPVQGADGILLALVSWIGCATAAIGIDATTNHVRSVTE
jgi:hypothetical protein